MAVFNILSFDPGLTTLGYAHSTYDTDTNIMTVHRFGTFKASKLAHKDKTNSALFGSRFIALNLLEEEVIRLIELYTPDYIASEDVFLHIRHINAFAALTLCIHAIKHAAFTKHMTIHTMAPCDIKKETSGAGHADKDAIQKAILNHPNITIVENKTWPIEKMCEHEADAIAVGFSFCSAVLPSLLLAADMDNPNDHVETTLDLSILNKKKCRLTKAEREELANTAVGIPVDENAPPVDVFAEAEAKQIQAAVDRKKKKEKLTKEKESIQSIQKEKKSIKTPSTTPVQEKKQTSVPTKKTIQPTPKKK